MKQNQQLDNLNTLANILQVYNTMLLQHVIVARAEKTKPRD